MVWTALGFCIYWGSVNISWTKKCSKMWLLKSFFAIFKETYPHCHLGKNLHLHKSNCPHISCYLSSLDRHFYNFLAWYTEQWHGVKRRVGSHQRIMCPSHSQQTEWIHPQSLYLKNLVNRQPWLHFQYWSGRCLISRSRLHSHCHKLSCCSQGEAFGNQHHTFWLDHCYLWGHVHQQLLENLRIETDWKLQKKSWDIEDR